MDLITPEILIYRGITENVIPKHISKQIIKMANLVNNDCDFFTDYNEDDDINISPDEFYLVFLLNGQVFGYMNFLFNIDINKNLFNILGQKYTSIYIKSMASFSNTEDNNAIYQYIRFIEPEFNIGSFMWSKFIDILNTYRGNSINITYFIFDHSTSSAYNYHYNNGMRKINQNLLQIIQNSKTNNNSIYELYSIIPDIHENDQGDNAVDLYFTF